MQVLFVVGSVDRMVPMESALLTTARQLSINEVGAGCTAAAVRKCARLKAATLLRLHAVFAASMVLVESASLMAAPPRRKQGACVASTAQMESVCDLAVQAMR